MNSDFSSFQVSGTQVNLVTTISGKKSASVRFLSKGVCWWELRETVVFSRGDLEENASRSPFH